MVFSSVYAAAQQEGASERPTAATLHMVSPAEPAANASSPGKPLTVIASVRSGGQPVSAGAVLFCDADAPFCEDSAILRKAQLRPDGTAVLRLSPAAVRRHRNLKAVFAGTTSYAASTSVVIPLTVPDPPYTSTTLLASSGTPSGYTLTATVQGGEWYDSAIPTGQVQFVDTTTSQTLGTVNLNSGMEVVTYRPSEEAGTTDASPVAMVLADFNNDGYPDVATANAGADTVDVLLSDGFGGLGAAGPALTPGSKPTSIAVADFNGDGNLDLVVNKSTGTGIAVFLGAGDGTFTEAATPPSTLAAPTAVAVGDFNHDGNMDIAVAGSNRVQILLGNGHGAFVKQALEYVIGSPISLAVADFNGDHFDDLRWARRARITSTSCKATATAASTWPRPWAHSPPRQPSCPVISTATEGPT
jgi:hypothetical protein